MKKITVQEAGNGFIVKILDGGEPEFKRPYENGILVFLNFNEMQTWLACFFVSSSKDAVRKPGVGGPVVE